MPELALPWKSLGGPENISTYEHDIVPNALRYVVLGIDLTMTGVDTIGPCFCSFAIGGHIFYWDSQSTGEGLGITFGWRGQIPIQKGDVLIIAADQPSTDLVVSSIAWGYCYPPRQIPTA